MLRRNCLGLILGAVTAVPAALSATLPVYEGSEGWLFPEWESTTVFDKAGIDANIALLQAAQALLAQRQIKLVLVVVPTKAVFYAQRLTADRVISPEVRGRYGYLMQTLAQAGLTAPDFVSALRAVDQAPQTAYYRTDYHWTSMGAEAAAAVAAQAVDRAVPQLRGNAGTGTALGEWVNERHYGDLATLYLLPARRAAIGHDVFRVRLAPTNSTNLFDEDPAPVHVLGNSFVQPYWGFSQKLSNALDRPVSLTWNVGNLGQWVIALKYLESKDFADNKPQVIVWQMNESQMQLGPNAPGLWDVQGLMTAQAWLGRVKAAVAK